VIPPGLALLLGDHMRSTILRIFMGLLLLGVVACGDSKSKDPVGKPDNLKPDSIPKPPSLPGSKG